MYSSPLVFLLLELSWFCVHEAGQAPRIAAPLQLRKHGGREGAQSAFANAPLVGRGRYAA
jgi:hypothetical protein